MTAEQKAQEFGTKKQVVELDENGELDVTGWEYYAEWCSKWLPFNVTKTKRIRLSELKSKREELEREIKELEKELEKIK